MTAAKLRTDTHVVAMYPDHASAEDAVRRLQANGIPMKDVSIIGKNFQATEKPIGFVTAGSLAKDGARIGATSLTLQGVIRYVRRPTGSMPTSLITDAPLTRPVDSGVSEQRLGRLIRVLRS